MRYVLPVGGKVYEFFFCEKYFHNSPYFRRKCPNLTFDSLTYHSTLDDPVFKEMTETIYQATCHYSEKKRAKILLDFFKINFTYKTDMEHFGSEEFWEFPVDFFFDKCGDCDGYALAYTHIANKIGLKARPVVVKGGHMVVEITKENGKIFYVNPPTGNFIRISEGDVLHKSTQRYPTPEFKASLEKYV